MADFRAVLMALTFADAAAHHDTPDGTTAVIRARLEPGGAWYGAVEAARLHQEERHSLAGLQGEPDDGEPDGQGAP